MPAIFSRPTTYFASTTIWMGLVFVALPLFADPTNYHGFVASSIGNSTVDYDIPSDSLEISNLGHTGQDGVRIDLGKPPKTGRRVTLLKKTVSGFDPNGDLDLNQRWQMRGTVAGSDFILWNAHKVHLSSPGSGDVNRYELSLDASAVGVSSMNYQMFSGGTQIGQVTVSNSEAVMMHGQEGGVPFAGFTDFEIQMDHCDNDCDGPGDSAGEPLVGLTLGLTTSGFTGIEFNDGTFITGFDEIRVTSDTNHTFSSFTSIGTEMYSTNDFRIHSMSYSSVPEPSTAVLMAGAGLFGLYLRRRK